MASLLTGGRMEKIPMTRRGFDALDEELKQLKTEARPAVIRDIAEARAHGDLSENAEYHAAKEEQEKIENRIMMLEYQLSKAQIVEDDEIDTSTASLGTTVTLKDTDLKKTFVYKLVGTEEADIKENKISISSRTACSRWRGRSMRTKPRAHRLLCARSSRSEVPVRLRSKVPARCSPRNR